MKTARQQLGSWGEQAAAEYLQGKGCQLLARNQRTPYGEIDLICLQGGELVFVEVKTRSSRAFGEPEDAVTAVKRRHLIQSCEHYLTEHPELDGDWRIDVIAIYRRPGSTEIELEHFENAVA